MDTEDEHEANEENSHKPLDDFDIEFLKKYGTTTPYSATIKTLENEIQELARRIDKMRGVEEYDFGLSPPSRWNLALDKEIVKEGQFLQVMHCDTIVNPDTEEARYVISDSSGDKYAVDLDDGLSPTDIDEGMRVGVDTTFLEIMIPLPERLDSIFKSLTLEEKPDVTYDDIGGCKQQIEKIREVVELPMLHPQKLVKLGIDPPKGVLLYGPPGTGKTLVAEAVANRTAASFIRVVGTELVQRPKTSGSKRVQELFELARSKKASIIFFDEVDAIGGARISDESFDKEVQCIMLEIVNQLDGFDARGNVKVLMATNRPDSLDPALLHPGRLDRKIEFGLPDLQGRTQIFKIHTRNMSCERNIRFELLARLCPNCTGADIRSVCTEAGIYAIRNGRRSVSEKDFIDAVNKVLTENRKFSATPEYMMYN